ncbi:MAG: DNA translocase FtsK [Anaerolineaceae bacterium]
MKPPISIQKRIEVAGISLLVVGLLLVLALLTSNSGMVTSWISERLTTWLGWGGYILPVTFVLVGLWFLLSRMDNFPNISFERLLGVVLLFVNLVTWLGLINSGGRIGSAIFLGLVSALGQVGVIILLIAWLLAGLIFLVDLSMADLILWLAERFKHSQSKFARFVRSKAKEQQVSDDLEHESEPLSTASLTDPATLQPYNPSAAGSVSTSETTPKWVLPEPSEMLNPIPAVPFDEESDEDRARVIEETLRSFSTPAHVVEIRRGPSVTLFGVEPDFVESRTGKTRVRVSNIVRLSDDLALALKASRIRIQAPVPGKGYVGVEVPNQKTALVSLLEVVESPSFVKHKSPMKFALGKDVSGVAATADLAAMPHLLIAGTTGSGKSVCVNAILAGYLLKLTPDQLRIVLVDPKRVELTGYNGIPHLLAPVIVDAEKVVGALQWMLREMDLRYRTFSANNARNITEYNEMMAKEGGKKYPFILVVIDELADLMMLAPEETEKSLTRLAQLARATGIHLILATQRPSVDILTGLIKANFPARIAFAVASMVDSRVILDQPGAERLLGRGDMLFQAPDSPAPVRLQGTYVSDTEINRITDFWRAQTVSGSAPERPDVAIFTSQSHIPLTQDPLWKEMEKDPDEDPIEREALALFRKEGRASVSMLQRKLRIGYTRAARLVEKLEQKGMISAPEPQTGTREILDWGDYPPLNED